MILCGTSWLGFYVAKEDLKFFLDPSASTSQLLGAQTFTITLRNNDSLYKRIFNTTEEGLRTP